MIFREPCRLHSQMQISSGVPTNVGKGQAIPPFPSTWNETVSAEPQRHGWLADGKGSRTACFLLAPPWTSPTFLALVHSEDVSRFGVSKVCACHSAKWKRLLNGRD